MTVEEKISHIREAAMEEARARGNEIIDQHQNCLLYTSDAADEL